MMIRRAKLIDKPLRPTSFLHNSFFIVLSQRSGQFVKIHSGTIFAFAPQFSHSDRIDDFENALVPIDPMNTTRMLGLV